MKKAAYLGAVATPQRPHGQEYATMSELTSPTLPLPIDLAPPPADTPRDLLGQILHEGARKMLAQAVHEEVQVYLAQRDHLRDGRDRQLVVRNGHLPPRTIQTPLGDL